MEPLTGTVHTSKYTDQESTLKKHVAPIPTLQKAGAGATLHGIR